MGSPARKEGLVRSGADEVLIGLEGLQRGQCPTLVAEFHPCMTAWRRPCAHH